ncbi:hypothetical protein QF030_000447 [Streptomyces rishiriensis]|uniref:DUF2637 domain-containing protein n=1 Tax=Streptomyces rishiriensis TaxID=68264 RepID=A0ABU0NGP6_STRRH|nr:DUF2637 domain-containing protein [Streptomyces rishiriensis]MDQ0578269.1 hypothetical protein [Streptomyces rishiriensis]
MADGGILQLTRTHRVLIGVVVAGAVVIAGIGFAGSYAAVRELALEKGFGNFSYVFPIGIDAGICVLLALDLLLTWIRIPFPLLRQTAWLLTAATIAFNGAAAWPDPLGTGMHAVIPILFVVSVEAARHAIGRIADITADKHMEGVRLTRWLLSPLPTFLLWRRMKLWELRSYEQVIKLEQERLVYQARLRSRFGRAWRRKAPVESLMPLRLARYGVPLTETAPAGLAAAGIEGLPIIVTVERAPAPTSGQPEGPELEATPVHESEATEPASLERLPAPAPAAVPARAVDRERLAEADAERFAEAYQAFLTRFQTEPSVSQWALWLRDAYGITTGAGGPLSEAQLLPLLQVLQNRYAAPVPEPAASEGPPPADHSADQWYDYFFSAWRAHAQEHGAYPDADALAAFVYDRDAITGDGGRPISGGDLADFVTSFQERQVRSSGPAGEERVAGPGAQAAQASSVQEEPPLTSAAAGGAQAAKEKHGSRVSTVIDDVVPGPEAVTGERIVLTTVDRYYVAWMEYQTEHGSEPTDEQLSDYLAAKGLRGRSGRPVSPSTLRRYFLPSRVYNVWAQHRMRNEEPAADVVVEQCAARGITAQYGKPVTADYIVDNAEDFERRWQALAHHDPDTQK